MQKLDFVRDLEEISERLQSNKIVGVFNKSILQPGNPYPFDSIIPLLFLSKSNYDQMKDDGNYSLIFERLNVNEIYREDNLSSLATILRMSRPADMFQQRKVIDLLTFHNTMLTLLNLSKVILPSNIEANDLNKSLEEGVIVFQIIIEGEGLNTEKYIKIFSALDDLVEAVNKALGEEDKKAQIILLDSGSDTNVGIKTKVDTAKSIFLIFKEIWDFIMSYKLLRHKQNNNALMESLTVRAEILRKVEEGVISPEEAKEYIHIIKSRTDTLIGMKVIPKQIAQESMKVDNKLLLVNFEALKLLTEPDSRNDDN